MVDTVRFLSRARLQPERPLWVIRTKSRRCSSSTDIQHRRFFILFDCYTTNMFTTLRAFVPSRKKIPKLLSATERPASPRQHFGQIFDVVQMSHTFKDSKTFVDCIPRKRPSRIRKSYLKQYGTQLDIARFVRDHFDMPVDAHTHETDPNAHDMRLPIREYIDAMWDVLTREPNVKSKYGSLLPLPYKYVVPGGRFREIYYWDSYFTLLGLKESGRHDLIEAMVKNFAHLIETYGFIPNGNRTYYLTRSQPPLFAHMVEILAEIQGERVYEEYGDTILKEYQYWMRGMKYTKFKNKQLSERECVVRMPDGSILNRYWDESIAPREESFIEDLELGRTMNESAAYYRHMRAGAASGWDYSSRWFTDETGRASIRTTDIIPIDLNVLLFQVEEILSRIYSRQNKHKKSNFYATRAQKRRDAIQTYLWDETQHWFTDYLISEQTRATQLTLAGTFALFGGIATPEQAASMVPVLEARFVRPGGVVTTDVHSGEQWDAPNGWAPLQYVTIIGLDRYGAHELAEDITQRWCSLNMHWYQEQGKLYEKYDVEQIDQLAGGGEYNVQEGFGWTNGVLLSLINKYHLYQPK